MDQFQIPVGELSFTVSAAGPESGELVLLLHGFPESSYEWTSVLPALADAGYRVIAPDQRGYSPGARPAVDDVSAYHVRHLVADVLAIADWLGGHTFHLVGHDWGALVAWSLAASYPERLRTLSIVSVPHPVPFAAARASDPDQQARSSYISLFRTEGSEDAFLADDAAMLRAAFAELPPDAADAHVSLLSEPGALRAALNWYRAWDDVLDVETGPVPVPTMLVWSTGDVALGRVPAEATASYVTGPYRFEVLEGVSHWIPEVAPERLTPLLLEHLRSGPAARTS